jgi:hypothetical protein
VVLLALVGFVWSRGGPRGLERVALAVVVLLWIVTANTHDWPGGYSYGPRLLADGLPWLAFLTVPVLARITEPRATWTAATTAVAITLAVTCAWSVFVNARGAWSWSTQAWNSRPVDAGVDAHPGRFFDWSDPQFLRADGMTFTDVYPYDTPPVLAPGQQCQDS